MYVCLVSSKKQPRLQSAVPTLCSGYHFSGEMMTYSVKCLKPLTCTKNTPPTEAVLAVLPCLFYCKPLTKTKLSGGATDISEKLNSNCIVLKTIRVVGWAGVPRGTPPPHRPPKYLNRV